MIDFSFSVCFNFNLFNLNFIELEKKESRKIN